MSKRVGSAQSSPDTRDTKRLRPQQQEGQDDAAPPLVYFHLKDATLPSSILALPHITKQLNLLLMTPDEAAVEAAATGDFEWMATLLARFEYFNEEEMIAETAAAHGHLQMVKMVAFHFYDYVGEFDEDISEIVSKMAAAAAKKGHLDVVNFLIPKNIDDEPIVLHGAKADIIRVLDAAATYGQLEVVKSILARRFVDYTHWKPGLNALSLAIAENHVEVAVFLLGVKKCKWDWVKACETALATHHEELIEMIQKVYEPPRENWTFFVEVATSGSVDTVKYLYENGYSDVVSVSLGFRVAAVYGKTAVVEFLLGTGSITPRVFDSTIEAAAESLRSHESTTLVFLFKTKRASFSAINQVFQTAAEINNVGLLKFLYENEDIADRSIIAAVQNLAAHGDETTQIVNFLYALPCISSDIIADVFLTAIRSSNRDLVELLRCDTRLSAKAFEKGFMEATVQGYITYVELLYEEHRISNEVMLRAFTKAATARYVAVVNQLANYVSGRCSMPEGMKFTVFAIAARNGQKKALDIMTKNRGGDWPLSMLKEALDSARVAKVKNYVRQLICDQLFSGRPQEVAASDNSGHVIHRLTWDAKT